MFVSFAYRTRIALGLSALVVLAPYSHAAAAGCCTVTSDSSSKVQLHCPDVNVEAQVRFAGDKSAALLRVHGGFEETQDNGTYFAPGQVAVVRSNLNGSGNSQAVVLNAYIDSNQHLNYVLSYRGNGDKVFVTSSIGGSSPICETSNALVEFKEGDIPSGASLVTSEANATTASAVYSKLFGGL